MCLLFMFLCVILSPALTGDDQLRCDTPVFDFGTIAEGVNAPVYFVLTNGGDTIIRIKEVRTFTACVEAQPLEARELAPGASLRLKYVFESLGYGGVTLDKTVEIHHDKSRKPLILRVRGKITPMAPHQVPFGEMAYNFFVLIDIRPEDAHQRGHLLGALNIPASRLHSWVKRNASVLSAELVIYLYCQDGTTSDALAAQLHKEGYPQFVSLVGGIQEWQKQHGTKWIISSGF